MQTGSPRGQHMGQSELEQQGWGVCRESCSTKSPKQYLKRMMVITKEPVQCVFGEMELQHRNTSKPYSQRRPTPVDHITQLHACESTSLLDAIASFSNVSQKPAIGINPASSPQVLGCTFSSKGLMNSGPFSALCQPSVSRGYGVS